MKDLSNLHHAYLLIGSTLEARRYLHSLFEEQGIKLVGSPDFFVYQEAMFGIDEARDLAQAAAKKAFVDKKIFFIAPERMTGEAQNALLKTFEDPYPDTHFFLALREESLVIPTLRSRMQTIFLDKTSESVGEAKKFLKLSIKERLDFARKFAEAEKNVSVFLDELLAILKESNSIEALKAIYPIRLESDNKSVSSRLILEHLSLVI